MLSKNELKATKELASALKDEAVYQFDIERRATGLSLLLADGSTAILTLLDEIERMRVVHTEEQGRAADRLRKALEDAQA